MERNGAVSKLLRAMSMSKKNKMKQNNETRLSGTYNRTVESIHEGKPPDISLYDKSLYAITN